MTIENTSGNSTRPTNPDSARSRIKKPRQIRGEMSVAQRRRSPIQPSGDQVQNRVISERGAGRLPPRSGARNEIGVPETSGCDRSRRLRAWCRGGAFWRVSSVARLRPALRRPHDRARRTGAPRRASFITGPIENAEVEEAGALGRRAWGRRVFPIAFLVAAVAGWHQCLGNICWRGRRRGAAAQRERDEQCRKPFRHISSVRCRRVAGNTATTLVRSVNMNKRQSGARPARQGAAKTFPIR